MLRSIRPTVRGHQMNEQRWETGIPIDEVVTDCTYFAAEYAAIHAQRINLIRTYNMWYAFGIGVSLTTYWVLVHLSLSISSLPLVFAGAAIATIIVAFAYRVVLTIDRDVVALYPRVVFLELVLGYDFYRDFLRRRPRGDTERSFIEKCEQIDAKDTLELWREIYSEFNARDFPGGRRLTRHFRLAAVLCTIMYWVVIGFIVLPQYFSSGG